MAISTEDRDYLVLMIDLRTCLANNDVALAESVRDAINNADQDEILTKQVNDVVTDGQLISRGSQGPDAYRVILEGVNCIESRAHKLTILDGVTVLGSKDTNAVGTWLEKTGIAALNQSVKENQRLYASLLIQMCVDTARYDLMDVIRAKLQEME